MTLHFDTVDFKEEIYDQGILLSLNLKVHVLEFPFNYSTLYFISSSFSCVSQLKVMSMTVPYMVNNIAYV